MNPIITISAVCKWKIDRCREITRNSQYKLKAMPITLKRAVTLANQAILKTRLSKKTKTAW